MAHYRILGKRDAESCALDTTRSGYVTIKLHLLQEKAILAEIISNPTLSEIVPYAVNYGIEQEGMKFVAFDPPGEPPYKTWYKTRGTLDDHVMLKNVKKHHVVIFGDSSYKVLMEVLSHAIPPAGA